MKKATELTFNENYVEDSNSCVCRGLIIASNSTMDVKINSIIGKKSGTLARLSARVLNSPKLTVLTNSLLPRACFTASQRKTCQNQHLPTLMSPSYAQHSTETESAETYQHLKNHPAWQTRFGRWATSSKARWVDVGRSQGGATFLRPAKQKFLSPRCFLDKNQLTQKKQV